MDTLQVEVYRFDELSEEAKEEALSRLDKWFIKANRCRFYENGIFFDALGKKVKALRAEDTYIGLLFQLLGKQTDEYGIDELWAMAKEESANKTIFPYTILMPCGATQPIQYGHQLVNLPNKDIPCPCGNPNHYIVKFIDKRNRGK